MEPTKIESSFMRNERDIELLNQIIFDRQRFKMGGNKGIHKPKTL